MGTSPEFLLLLLEKSTSPQSVQKPQRYKTLPKDLAIHAYMRGPQHYKIIKQSLKEIIIIR